MILWTKNVDICTHCRWHGPGTAYLGSLLPIKANRSRGRGAKPQVRGQRGPDSWVAEEGQVSPRESRRSTQGRDVVTMTAPIETTHADSIPTQIPPGSRVKAFWFEQDDRADGLDFGLATDRDTFEQALRLQHDQYVAQGYMDPHPSGLRLSVHHALPSTCVFVARSGDRVVGTMTLIVDSALGLPMDEIYADDLRELRRERSGLTEFSGLALHPDYKRSGVAILLRLIRMVVLYAIEVLHLSDVCIAINPRHAAFYRKAFYFRDLGGLKSYGKVNGAPAVALRLDLDLLRGFISELAAGRPVSSEVYSFLFCPRSVESAMARLTRDAQRAASPGAAHAVYFFSRHDALAKASPADRAYLVKSCQALAELASSRSGAPGDPDALLDFGNWVGLSALVSH
jgi:hypothetical protein